MNLQGPECYKISESVKSDTSISGSIGSPTVYRGRNHILMMKIEDSQLLFLLSDLVVSNPFNWGKRLMCEIVTCQFHSTNSRVPLTVRVTLTVGIGVFLSLSLKFHSGNWFTP